MVIRNVVVFIILGIFLGGVSFYYINNFSPFDREKIETLIVEQDIEEKDFDSLNVAIRDIQSKGLIFDYFNNNAYLVAAMLSGSFIAFFTAIHLSIEKLFFRKFFESPSLFDAFRRGLFIAVVGMGTVYLRLVNIENENLLILPALVLALELFISFVVKPDLTDWWKSIRKRMEKIK